jgi:DNA-binding LacI/PurR family transcriptional regulator
MRKVTIKDVANHAGVSIATVSYVLNGKDHKVSAETIEAIQNSIKALNYIPNISARSLVKNDSKLIGVIIPQTENTKQLVLENPFYSEVVGAIEAVLREEGYHIILSGVDKDQTYLDFSISRNLDGAVVLGLYPENLYNEFRKTDIPIVLIDSYINDKHFANVGIDDELGGYIATKYLIDMGHKNIALVTGMIRKDGVVEKRFLGYKKALQEAGIFYNPDHVFEKTVSYHYGLEAGREIGEYHPNITAVFATADLMAFGVIRGIIESNKQVPDAVSVVGFDDIPMASMFLPPLTTVRQNIAMKGVRAAKLLLEQLEGGKRGALGETVTLVELELIERQTVAKIQK